MEPSKPERNKVKAAFKKWGTMLLKRSRDRKADSEEKKIGAGTTITDSGHESEPSVEKDVVSEKVEAVEEQDQEPSEKSKKKAKKLRRSAKKEKKKATKKVTIKDERKDKSQKKSNDTGSVNTQHTEDPSESDSKVLTSSGVVIEKEEEESEEKRQTTGVDKDEVDQDSPEVRSSTADPGSMEVKATEVKAVPVVSPENKDGKAQSKEPVIKAKASSTGGMPQRLGVHSAKPLPSPRLALVPPPPPPPTPSLSPVHKVLRINYHNSLR